MLSLSDTPCQSILPNDGKIATKLWLAMGPFQIMLMSIRQTRSLDSRTNAVHSLLFNQKMAGTLSLFSSLCDGQRFGILMYIAILVDGNP